MFGVKCRSALVDCPVMFLDRARRLGKKSVEPIVVKLVDLPGRYHDSAALDIDRPSNRDRYKFWVIYDAFFRERRVDERVLPFFRFVRK